MDDLLYVKIKYLEKNTSKNDDITAEFTYCPIIIDFVNDKIILSIDTNIKWTCDAYPLSNIVFSYKMTKNNESFNPNKKYLIKNIDKNYSYVIGEIINNLEVLDKNKINEALIELCNSRFILDFII